MNSASLLERSTTFLSGFSPKRLNPPNCANRPRSDQTTHREGRPQSRRPNPEPATSCYCWSWRGLHRRTMPGTLGFQHPETTPPLIPTTLRTAPLTVIAVSLSVISLQDLGGVRAEAQQRPTI